MRPGEPRKITVSPGHNKRPHSDHFRGVYRDLTQGQPPCRTPPYTSKVENGLARLRFTEAARGNPIDLSLCNAICAAANELSSRSDLRAVLVTAEGKAFSYGGDIANFVAKPDDLPAEIKRMTTTMHSAVARWRACSAWTRRWWWPCTGSAPAA